MEQLNETHQFPLHSWVESGNSATTDFPIQNLPIAAFRRTGGKESFRGGVAIGDQILDLAAVTHTGVFSGVARTALAAASHESLNALMSLGRPAWSALRLAISRALRVGAAEQSVLQTCLVPHADVEFTVPARIGDYTDFYTSIYHATNIGKQFRPDTPLLPNYKWVPIGYHGRVSSIGISGQSVARPKGQIKAAGATAPVLAPSRCLDIELELGIFIGSGNDAGDPISISNADSHVFGFCLLNDWTARDIQAWEYQPLGPFLSKNFATSLSPWIVSLEALAPFRVPFLRSPTDPQPLPYLDSEQNRRSGGYDIQLEIGLQTSQMRESGRSAFNISRTSYRHAYWTAAQLVAHHTINGCNLQPGDLFGSGTMSGPMLAEAGALIEITAGGKTSVQLPSGERRTFLEDGDSVVLRGWCEKAGNARIGFGECWGTVLGARTLAI